MGSRLVPALVLTIVVFVTGCGRHKMANSEMSDAQQQALTVSLAKLEATLASKSPFVFAKLAPGAADEDIQALREELGGARIQCLELWYKWHNGCVGHTTDLLPLGRMLSIAEALEDRSGIQNVPFVDEKRKSAWKILEDGAGDGFFLDIASPRPRVFYHMLEDPFPRDYGTLEEFVKFISDVHAANLASEEDNGTVAFDIEGYQKVEDEYLRGIGDAE